MEDQNQNKKVLLIILDGWGLSPIAEGNATLIARTPVLDYVYATYPKISLAASGLEVGLNRGEMGNSEVGHLNMGSGRVVWENLPRIDFSIESGEFFENQNLLAFFNNVKNNRLHLVGLVSSGGVHSHIRHLGAILKSAKMNKIKEVYIHFISDGRDTPPNTSLKYIEEAEHIIKRAGVGRLATIIGRYYAMDRDKRHERTQKAYNLYTAGEGQVCGSVKQAVESSYQNGKSDEFIEPCLIDQNGLIKPEDSILFFNFRADRMRQLVETFVTDNFSSYTLDQNSKYNMLSMTQYEKSYNIPIVFEPVDLHNVLADVVEVGGKRQCHISETEKYAHVTYFFNGGREEKHPRETQVLVPSPKVATYDLAPEMSAEKVALETVEALQAEPDFVLVNFANGDMVGHTGNLQATVTACEAVDKCLAKVLSKASEIGYNTIITADHGNCEVMIDPATSQPSTEHTTSPVPFVYMNFFKHPFRDQAGYNFSEDDLIAYSAEPYRGVLADVASTVVDLLGLERPKELEGINLIEGI
jgi:2,3-bisphosphoglycerate-independent phosphoglycerate mutase